MEKTLPNEPARTDSSYSHTPLRSVAVTQVEMSGGGGALVAIRGQKTIIMCSYDAKLSERSLNNQIIIDYDVFPTRRSDSMQSEYARGKANQLAIKYGVLVDIVATEKDYYSDTTLGRTAKEGIYFISEENCHETAKVTEYLIKYNRLKYELANASRIEKATEKSVELSGAIQQIKDNYALNHAGKAPSLHKIAAILNDSNIKSPGGKGKWVAATVKRVQEKSSDHFSVQSK